MPLVPPMIRTVLSVKSRSTAILSRKNETVVLFHMGGLGRQSMKAEKADIAREAIKRAAQRLFAARGVDAVSVRDILAAAGQRNGASLHYYFGSKDDLVAQLVIDGARLIDDRRNARLDALEAAGGPRSLGEVMEVLILPSTNLGREGGEGY